MNQHQAMGLAGLMRYLRENSGARGSLQLVEILFVVAGGCDSPVAIATATGASARTIRRALDTLRGRGSTRDGNYRPSALMLLECYRHPHIKNGLGYRLSPMGAALLAQMFSISDDQTAAP